MFVVTWQDADGLLYNQRFDTLFGAMVWVDTLMGCNRINVNVLQEDAQAGTYKHLDKWQDLYKFARQSLNWDGIKARQIQRWIIGGRWVQ